MTDGSDVRRAVVDRIVEDIAVLLVEPDEQEHQLAAGDLPAGAGEGAWLLVTGHGVGLRVVGRDAQGEEGRRSEMSQRMARLRSTRGGDRFDRDG